MILILFVVHVVDRIVHWINVVRNVKLDQRKLCLNMLNIGSLWNLKVK